MVSLSAALCIQQGPGQPDLGSNDMVYQWPLPPPQEIDSLMILLTVIFTLF